MDRRPSASTLTLDRRQLSRWLVGLVTVSAVLSAVYVGATPAQIGLVGAVGAVVGVALVIALGGWP